MSDTFKYPNIPLALKTLTIDRLISSANNITPNQVENKTRGGKRLVANVGDETFGFSYIFDVPISSDSTDLADVLEFFSSTYTNYGANTFVWTDHLAVSRTVSLIGGIQEEYLTPTHRRITIQIEKEN